MDEDVDFIVHGDIEDDFWEDREQTEEAHGDV